MLGIIIGPSINWDRQFLAIIDKIKIAINRLKNTIIAVSTASIYYNMYLIKKVYFGYGIFKISQQQENILKKIYEPVILRKMRLSEKLPRSILYARKSSLGVGLISPTTIIDVLALKLYIGHNRLESEVSKIIKINEENTRLQYSYLTSVLEMNREWKPNIITWSNEIQEMLRKRNLKFIN